MTYQEILDYLKTLSESELKSEAKLRVRNPNGDKPIILEPIICMGKLRAMDWTDVPVIGGELEDIVIYSDYCPDASPKDYPSWRNL